MASSSQQHSFARQFQAPTVSTLPPPPPPPQQGTSSTRSLASETHVAGGQSLHRAAVDASRRLRPTQHLPSITTSLGPQTAAELATASSLHNPHTPSSVISAPVYGVPFSPYASVVPSPLTATAPRLPASTAAMRGNSVAATVVAPYNPQEWSGRGTNGSSGPVTAGGYIPHASPTPIQQQVRAADLTGMESANLPSPPPPYSPSSPQPNQNPTASPLTGQHYVQHQPTPIHQNTSNLVLGSAHQMVASPGGISPYDQQRLSTYSHDSPRGGTPPAFPPPPSRNGRDRSASRTRPDARSLLNGLSALTSRSRTTDHTPPTSAIDSLRFNTNEALTRTHTPPHLQIHGSSLIPSGPIPIGADSIGTAPAARRAASTGGISAGSRRDNEPQSSSGTWQGTPSLPGPPPGPPPGSIRSQSLSGTSDRSYSSTSGSGVHTPVAAPPTRRPPQRGTQLGPVPPTPIDWVPNTPRAVTHTRSPSGGTLHVDTSVANNTIVGRVQQAESNVSRAGSSSSSGEAYSAHPQTARVSSATSLSRRPANRDSSARGIRERRSESRAARERNEVQTPLGRVEQEDQVATPADLPLGSSRKPFDIPNSTRSAGLVGQASDVPVPLQIRHRTVASSGNFAQTPPFTPALDSANGRSSHGKSPALPGTALPTPPQRHGEEYFRPSPSLPRNNRDHRVSQNTSPNEELHGLPSSKLATPRTAGLKTFSTDAVERHRAFIEREANAKDDRERLEMFADYIVAESRLRRDRYAAAFDSMAGEVFDLTRDLWRSYGSGRRSATPIATPALVTDGPLLTRTTTSSSVESHKVASSPDDYAANFTPRTDMDSPASVNSQSTRGEDPMRNGTFKPSLSPIPSMAMSTVPDEQDSRGRPPTRWWEASVDNESVGQGGRRTIERSKRESKYMGVPVEHLAQLENAAATPVTPHTGGTPGPSAPVQMFYGANEYPPEKIDHEIQQQLTPRNYPYWNHSAPTTPNPYKLDVSRLVTLPPPYPRHHPALNNSHPDLTNIRTTHRGLADLSEVHAVKSTFSAKVTELRDQQKTDAAARRDAMRSDIQSQVQSGSMSYADAAAAEKQFEINEPRRLRDGLQVQFDAYQTDVMTPLHALLSERITRCGAELDQFRAALEASRDSANEAQEEGDEKPELLEKLTLFKWLFEAREALHRELFIADSDRCEMYKVLVVLPYRAAGNEDKAVEAEQFFARDDFERRGAYEREVQVRAESFMSVVEENVTRGVEDLLGAFWDIAPGLAAVVHKIPDDLEEHGHGGGNGMPDLLIPDSEYEENPSYVEHPLQYLYSLLVHAEKSAYQFIESQTNLLCLLHEAKSTVMTAGSRVVEGERIAAGESKDAVRNEMEEVRRVEEGRLTSDLKDKVGVADRQWREGLGDAIGSCREKVEAFLVKTGGWDETLQE